MEVVQERRQLMEAIVTEFFSGLLGISRESLKIEKFVRHRNYYSFHVCYNIPSMSLESVAKSLFVDFSVAYVKATPDVRDGSVRLNISFTCAYFLDEPHLPYMTTMKKVLRLSEPARERLKQVFRGWRQDRE